MITKVCRGTTCADGHIPSAVVLASPVADRFRVFRCDRFVSEIVVEDCWNLRLVPLQDDAVDLVFAFELGPGFVLRRLVDAFRSFYHDAF